MASIITRKPDLILCKANSGHKDLGFMCLDVFKDSDTPCRVRSFDGHLVRGPFIIYRTHEGVTVDATPHDLARARVSFRPVTCDPHEAQFSTLAALFSAMRCAVDREGVSSVQSANLQYLLEQVTRPFESTPADLTHARGLPPRLIKFALCIELCKQNVFGWTEEFVIGRVKRALSYCVILITHNNFHDVLL